MSYYETLSVDQELDHFMSGLIRRNPGEKEFHQAVHDRTGPRNFISCLLGR